MTEHSKESETLADYMAKANSSHKYLRPELRYFEIGDFATKFLTDDRCYSKRIDEHLTLYFSEKGDQIVGYKIKGVRNNLVSLIDDKADEDEKIVREFDVTLECGVMVRVHEIQEYIKYETLNGESGKVPGLRRFETASGEEVIPKEIVSSPLSILARCFRIGDQLAHVIFCNV